VLPLIIAAGQSTSSGDNTTPAPHKAPPKLYKSTVIIECFFFEHVLPYLFAAAIR
jgi:hypothetical protein